MLHLRIALAAEPLAVLFGSSRTGMHRTLLKIRRLLAAHNIAIPPADLAPPQARVQDQNSDSHKKIKTTR